MAEGTAYHRERRSAAYNPLHAFAGQIHRENWEQTEGFLVEEAVLKRHREIFYGLLFGFGAAILDTWIDSRAQNRPFWDVSLGMSLYRLLFILFGFLLGWLLWRKNTGERAFRSLQDEVQELRQKIGAPITLIHAQAQLLLGQHAAQLSPEVQSEVRIIYEQSQKLQSIQRG